MNIEKTVQDLMASMNATNGVLANLAEKQDALTAAMSKHVGARGEFIVEKDYCEAYSPSTENSAWLYSKPFSLHLAKFIAVTCRLSGAGNGSYPEYTQDGTMYGDFTEAIYRSGAPELQLSTARGWRSIHRFTRQVSQLYGYSSDDTHLYYYLSTSGVFGTCRIYCPIVNIDLGANLTFEGECLWAS